MLYQISINGKTYLVEAKRATGIYKNTPRHPLGTLAKQIPASQTVREALSASTEAGSPGRTAAAPAAQTAAAPAAKASQPAGEPPADSAGKKVLSPMPGSVFDIRTTPGQTVTKGEVLLVLEAMKMEIEVVAPEDGIVDQLFAAKGDFVETGTLLAVLR